MENQEVLNESVWGRRNYDFENHWEKLDLSKFKITKPTVFCLGGNGTITEKAANGNVAILEGMLNSVWGNSDLSKDIDFISVGYGRHCKNQKQYENKSRGDLSESEKESFVDNILIPLCLNDDGNLLSIEEFRKNLSLVTFVTHCAGSQELNNLIECFIIRISGVTNRFDTDYIKALCHSIKHVSYAPINGMRQYMPTTYFYSARDNGQSGTIISNDLQRSFGVDVKKIDSISIFYNECKKFMGENSTLGVVSRCLQNRNRTKEVLDEHSYSILRKLQTGETKPFGGRVSPNRDCMSKMMAVSIAKNVENSFINKTREEYVSMPLAEIKISLEDILNSYNPKDLEPTKFVRQPLKKYKFKDKFALVREKV